MKALKALENIGGPLSNGIDTLKSKYKKLKGEVTGLAASPFTPFTLILPGIQQTEDMVV